MQTNIGKALHSAPRLKWLAAGFAFVVITLDLLLVANGFNTDLRMVLAVTGCLFYAFLSAYMGERGESWGFQLVPIQGWSYWLKATAVLGIVLLVILSLTALVIFVVLRRAIPKPHFQGSQIWYQFLWMCITAPLLEEVLYRLVVCPPTAALTGAYGSILIGGALFAGLHVLYGNPSPENQLGGFFLTWAFLKSGRLVVPVALHSLGNFCAFLFNVGHLTWWNYYAS